MPRTDNDTWDLATSVGATATMVAAARAIASKADNPLIEDRFAEPLVRAGLFGYLPPAAQDRLLDNVTALSAKGSRLACEAVSDMSELDIERAREMMRRATAKWREHGFELEFADLGYQGERNDVASCLQNLGWRSVGTKMSQLLADNGLAAIPQNNDSVSVADTTYYTCVLST